MKTVWINGRFLTRPVTGVERVALEVLGALCRDLLDADGRTRLSGQTVQFRLAVPQHTALRIPPQLASLPVVPLGWLQGHAWEQVTLAGLPAQDWVINLCNTAPMLRRRQLVFIHDAQVFAIPQNFSLKFRCWYQWMLRVLSRRSALLVTNSAFSQQELQRYLGKALERCVVAHLGANHMQRIQPALSADMLAQLPNRPFILAVSSANPNKNFQLIIELLPRLQALGLACVMVGQRDQRMFQQVELNDRVVHLGYVSDENLAALYQRAFCLVYPSFYEGFGLPPLEAMWLGAPVVVSNCSALPEVCQTAAIYCDPNDAESLYQALANLVARPDQVAQLRQSGQQHARQFTWQNTAQKILQQLVQADQSV